MKSKIVITKQEVILIKNVSLNTCSLPNVHYKTKRRTCAVFQRRRNTRNKNPYLVYRRFNWRQRRYVRYKNSQLSWCFELFTFCDQLVIANCRERVYFEQQILAFLLVSQTHNLSIKFADIPTGCRFLYLVKQSQSFPHETLHIHVATRPTFYPDRKTIGATIDFNVTTCSQ